MKNRLVAAFVLTGGVLAVGSPVLAHHGNAAYADTITEFKQATVTKVAWANPHALINFDAKNAKGEIVHMVVETAAPQALRLIGWSKDSRRARRRRHRAHVRRQERQPGRPAEQDHSRRRHASCTTPSWVEMPGARPATIPTRSRHAARRLETMRNRIAASVMAVVAALACSSAVSAQRGPARQARSRGRGEGFISEGIPKMPNPPGPAPKRDLSGAWVGPGPTNKPEPVPPMTPAGEAQFKQRKAYGNATSLGEQGRPSRSVKRSVHHLRSPRLPAQPDRARDHQPRRNALRLRARPHPHRGVSSSAYGARSGWMAARCRKPST